MITCNLMGGLGNQLFQIFATISYGIKSTSQFKFLDLETLVGGSSTLRYTFWNSFLSQLKPFLISELPQVQVIREKEFSFNELSVIQMINKDTMIYGYFQSYKYFEKYQNNIMRLLRVETQKENVNAHMPANTKNLISIFNF